METFNLKHWTPFADQHPNVDASINHVVIDSRRINTPDTVFIALQGNHTDGHQYLNQAAAAGCGYCVIRNDWTGAVPHSIKAIRVENPLRALQEIAGLYRAQFDVEVIAIMGSYGKTMLKDLLYEIVSQEFPCMASPESFNSQIGVALSLLKIRSRDRFAIIEAGNSFPGETVHLAKMMQPDHVILTGLGKRQYMTLGSKEKAVAELLPMLNACSGWTLGPSNLPIPLTHHWKDPILDYQQNLKSMASSAASLCGVSSQTIHKILDHHRPIRMSAEIWQPEGGPRFINDRYSADPLSIDEGLWHLRRHSNEKGKKYFVFSGIRGQPTQQDYDRITESIKGFKVDSLHCVNIPPLNVPMVNHTDVSDALRCILKEAGPADSILIKGSEKFPLDSLAEVVTGSALTTQCTINLAAIKHNIELIRKNLPEGTRLMPVLKASAYGTQDRLLARLLEECGVDILAVAYVDEAIALKQTGARQSIFSLHAALYESEKVAKWDLEVGVSSQACIDALALAAEKYKKRIKVHLHVDTGMARFGCRAEDAVILAVAISQNPHLQLEGIMTHFAAADDPAHDAFTREQANTLTRLIAEIEAKGILIPWRHASNSSAVMRHPLPQFNMVRTGLALYGLTRTAENPLSNQLRLALSLTTKLIGINFNKAGETVGYGRRWTAEKDTLIGIIPIGYYDGLHRQYSNRAQVMIRGKKVPLIGTICMDYCMCDLTEVPDAAIGDTVLIFGEDEAGNFLAPAELAKSGGTIVHELITCIGPRVHRVFIHEERP